VARYSVFSLFMPSRPARRTFGHAGLHAPAPPYSARMRRRSLYGGTHKGLDHRRLGASFSNRGLPGPPCVTSSQLERVPILLHCRSANMLIPDWNAEFRASSLMQGSAVRCGSEPALVRGPYERLLEVTLELDFGADDRSRTYDLLITNRFCAIIHNAAREPAIEFI
jgi:hypothetical protein